MWKLRKALNFIITIVRKRRKIIEFSIKYDSLWELNKRFTIKYEWDRT